MSLSLLIQSNRNRGGENTARHLPASNTQQHHIRAMQTLACGVRAHSLVRPSQDGRAGPQGTIFFGGTCQNGLKRLLHVSGIEGRGLDEREGALLGVAPGIVRGHRAQVAQVALVSHEHNDDVVICMIAQLLEPPIDIFERDMLGNVVH